MAITTLTTLKNWFKNGLKPDQAQFWAWMDSYWHKHEAIPSGSIDGLQQLLDAKADKTSASASSQSGVYDPGIDYVFSASQAQYVSYINAASADAFFQIERYFRLRENAPAGQSPEAHPEHWVHQGTVLGDISMDDVSGLTEAINTHAYTVDFGTASTIAQDVNMHNAAVVTKIIAKNVAILQLTYAGGVQKVIDVNNPNIAIQANEVLVWEIGRTNEGELSALGIKLTVSN